VLHDDAVHSARRERACIRERTLADLVQGSRSAWRAGERQQVDHADNDRAAVAPDVADALRRWRGQRHLVERGEGVKGTARPAPRSTGCRPPRVALAAVVCYSCNPVIPAERTGPAIRMPAQSRAGAASHLTIR